ncbi:hypothetical protein [Flavobacterium reichenbachii]|uniref:Lipocalin-like domain-containing protein n=1 Tax=Flavobacterium reichenbachii TaxID=362418 RepID=A0A085ZK12_9FLAO|nr:hypothetical protein [Flavobacterium reichenbachii]KFF04776.1 hypothetical protein IW19_04160 [Flavobacterium reichenbachii]OXB10325.1 hypothetical protein B0A68_22295 [Flavobacterium reichenbachii]
MKKIFLFLCIIIVTTGCKSQTEDFSLIGKWKAIESINSNGAKKFHTDIENGNEITFGIDNIVIDHHLNIKGKYEIIGDSLHLIFPKKEFFYFCRTNEWSSKKMFLDPVNDKYQLICDEGCTTIYKKIE